jgi:hypothetical protein
MREQGSMISADTLRQHFREGNFQLSLALQCFAAVHSNSFETLHLLDPGALAMARRSRVGDTSPLVLKFKRFNPNNIDFSNKRPKTKVR